MTAAKVSPAATRISPTAMIMLWVTSSSIMSGVAGFSVPSFASVGCDCPNRQACQPPVLKQPCPSLLEHRRRRPLSLRSATTRTRTRTRSTVCLSSSEDSALDTRRLPLDKILQSNGRDYLFTTRKNIRNFEWTEKEAEELFESISSLESDSDTLELNSITVMEKPLSTEEKKLIGKTSNLYDVHDGQQRLISLCLFFAAMRDSLCKWPDCEEDVQDVAGRIYPYKTRTDPVFRIQLREKNARYLRLILSKGDADGNPVEDLFKGECCLPPTRTWKNLPEWDQCILEVYRYFFHRMEELDKEAVLYLLERAVSDVYLLVCKPSNTKIARNIVMGQSKGKNIEPVDEFKGMVCFLNIDDEDVQDATLEKWNDLSDDVTRDLLQEACLLVAQAGLQKGWRKNCEVDLLEEYLHIYMAKQEGVDGKHLFEKKVLPAARALKEFRDGNVELVGKGEGIPSLNFLRSATMIATSKDIEIVILHFLLEFKSITHDETRRLELEKKVKKLEGIALWMMLIKPKPKVRIQRCMDIISSCNNTACLDGDSALDLSTEEKKQVLQVLDMTEFGAKTVDTKKAKILLERLNEHCLVDQHQQRIEPMAKTLHLEHILPQKYDGVPTWREDWTADHASEWMHRLGNLALLNQKKNAKIGNGPFEKKTGVFKASPYPLTNQISKLRKWNKASVAKQHRRILDLATMVFDL